MGGLVFFFQTCMHACMQTCKHALPAMPASSTHAAGHGPPGFTRGLPLARIRTRTACCMQNAAAWCMNWRRLWEAAWHSCTWPSTAQSLPCVQRTRMTHACRWMQQRRTGRGGGACLMQAPAAAWASSCSAAAQRRGQHAICLLHVRTAAAARSLPSVQAAIQQPLSSSTCITATATSSSIARSSRSSILCTAAGSAARWVAPVSWQSRP